MNLFDSSALLCFLRGEEGADVVEREPLVGGACSAANWSEVAQKVAQRLGAVVWTADTAWGTAAPVRLVR
jgi:PIN domain nuclease of toxin-antitoxin system